MFSKWFLALVSVFVLASLQTPPAQAGHKWDRLGDIAKELDDAFDNLEEMSDSKHIDRAEDFSDELKEYLNPTHYPYHRDFSKIHVRFLREAIDHNLNRARGDMRLMGIEAISAQMAVVNSILARFDAHLARIHDD